MFLLICGFIVVYAILEFFYLYLSKSFHAKHIESIQGSPVHISKLAAVSTYVVLAGGVFYLVIYDIFKAERKQEMPNLGFQILKAFVIGAVVYGTYNLTNKSTFTNYTWTVVAIDTIWGITCTILVTLACHSLKLMTFDIKSPPNQFWPSKAPSLV
jgi:uncharacterized membrane protein